MTRSADRPRSRSFLPAVFGVSIAVVFLGSCSTDPERLPKTKDHPIVQREALEPREVALEGFTTTIRLDDLSSNPVFSDGPAVPDSSGSTWQFELDAEGWTFTGGGGPDSDGSALRWDVVEGKEGLVSPPIGVPFSEIRAIEVELSSSAGKRLRVWWSENESFDPKFSIESEILPGGEPVRYSVKTSTLRGYEGLKLERLRLDPTDGEAADVRVASVRLIGREDFYAGRGHGLSQENLENQIRHVLFHRAPSKISWELTLPDSAMLDTGVGLLDAGDGATVSVRVESGKKTETLMNETVSEDGRWHDRQVDLSRWGGRDVRLVLEAKSSRSGQIVMWSNPMVFDSHGVAGAPGASAPPPPSAPPSTQPPPPPPNVLVYLVDTLRADHLGSYAHANPTSPVIDRMAAEGVLFERCLSPASWTRPSVASLLTSLAPPAHGATGHGSAISDGVVTLAEQMRSAGFVTASFTTSTHAGSSANLQQGFDFLYELPAIVKDPRMVLQGRDKDFSKKNSTYVNRAVIPWLDRYGERPFFLYVHAMDPHAPYLPPEPYDRMFHTGYTGAIDGDFNEETGFMAARSREELDHVMSLYDGDIRYNDERIGELLAELESRGVLDRTLVIITSDHGEEFYEHGDFEHGHSLHAELLDVPLIMRLPGALPIGRRVRRHVSTLDLMPTVLDLMGIPANPDVQGVSLLMQLASPEEEDQEESDDDQRPVFSWRETRHGEENVAIAKGRWKAIVLEDGTVQLYDRRADPGELNDLAGDNSRIAHELRAEAVGWLSTLRRITTPTGAPTVSIDAYEREWLDALGYINN